MSRLKDLIRGTKIDKLKKEEVIIVECNRTFFKKLPNGSWRGSVRCPFHDEKTPSMSVDLAKRTFHCFSCRKSGDLWNVHLGEGEQAFLSFPVFNETPD